MLRGYIRNTLTTSGTNDNDKKSFRGLINKVIKMAEAPPIISSMNPSRKAPLEGRLVRDARLNRVYTLRHGKRMTMPGVWQYDLVDQHGSRDSIVADSDIGPGRTFKLLGKAAA